MYIIINKHKETQTKMSSSSTSSAGCGCGCGIVTLIALIFGIVIFASLSNHIALIDNECFDAASQFVKSTEYIPGVIREEYNVTWVSVHSNMTENHDLSEFKLQSLMAGIFNLFVGFLARTSYPDDSSCLNREGKYLGMATTLMVFQIIDISIIVLMCCCCWGIVIASKK